jgi:hypothetical protein
MRIDAAGWREAEEQVERTLRDRCCADLDVFIGGLLAYRVLTSEIRPPVAGRVRLDVTGAELRSPVPSALPDGHRRSNTSRQLQLTLSGGR